MGKPRLWPRGQAQRLGCVDEVPSRGFPRVTPVLRFKAYGSGKSIAGTCLTYGCKTRLSTQRS